MRALNFKDSAGNKTLVNTTTENITSLYKVVDVVLNERKYFEKVENANAYCYEENLRNPATGKKYKRLFSLSTGLRRGNGKAKISTEELKKLS